MSDSTGRRRRGRPRKSEQNQAAVHHAPEEDVHKQPSDVPEEQRADWQRRIRDEDAQAKKASKKVEHWYELHGAKLIKKVYKKNGGCYSFYVSNVEKEPSVLNDEDVRKYARGESLLSALKKREK